MPTVQNIEIVITAEGTVTKADGSERTETEEKSE